MSRFRDRQRKFVIRLRWRRRWAVLRRAAAHRAFVTIPYAAILEDYAADLARRCETAAS